MHEERTEPASPRRKEEARKRGQIARSADLSAAAVLAAGVGALAAFGGGLAARASAWTADRLGNLHVAEAEAASFVTAAGAAALSLAPLAAAVLVAGIGINLLQTGALFTWAPLAPDPARLDAAAGLGRMLSARAFGRLAVALLKLAAVGLVAGLTLRSEAALLAGLGQAPPERIAAVAAALLGTLAFRTAFVFAVLGVLSWAWERLRWERDLRMTRAEAREELRRYEGDPMIREWRRALQRRLALQRMVHAVPEATIVVVNPVHLAVALRWDAASMDAPLVVAKGAERSGERIRASALEHDVPVVERTDLARALFRAVEVGRPVPPELYEAVAETLALALKLRRKEAA